MAKKPPTAEERQHMARVAALGCIVCEAPAVCHHPRFAAGAGQRSGHFLVIPLCPVHHQGHGYGVSIHDGQRAFELLYGTEEDLLEETIRKLCKRLI